MKEQKIAPGHKIIGFDSMEEMEEYMAAQEEKANAETIPEQQAITWGDYVIRFVDGLVIWGDLETQEELAASEAGEDEEEARYVMEHALDSYNRGYRFGKWFSEVEPTGEYGSAHVVSLWKITKEEFDTAGENDWQPWPELLLKIATEMKEAGKSHE